jgi:hypothetical protein
MVGIWKKVVLSYIGPITMCDWRYTRKVMRNISQDTDTDSNWHLSNKSLECEMSGSNGGEFGDVSLLGYSAM